MVVAVVAVAAMTLTQTVPAARGAKAARKPPVQALGEIVSISAEATTIKTVDGTELKLIIIPGTILGSKTDPKQTSDFKAGDKVAVSYKDDGTNKIARSIALQAADKKGAGKKRGKAK